MTNARSSAASLREKTRWHVSSRRRKALAEIGLGTSEWTGPVEHLTPADGSREQHETGIRHLYAAIIIIIIPQILNSILFFCILVDRAARIHEGEAESVRKWEISHFLCFFSPFPTSLKRLNTETCLLQLHLRLCIIRPRRLSRRQTAQRIPVTAPGDTR